MRKILLFLAFILTVGAAQAQIKCWNEGSRRVCGDTPPAGARVTMLKAPAADAAATDAKKAPLAPAKQEKDYRERQKIAQQAAEKLDREMQDRAARKESCDRTQEYLRTLESGQRIARTNAGGERYYLDEAQVAQETAKARQSAQDACRG